VSGGKNKKKKKKKKEGKKNSLLLHKNHQSAFVRLCVQSQIKINNHQTSLLRTKETR